MFYGMGCFCFLNRVVKEINKRRNFEKGKQNLRIQETARP